LLNWKQRREKELKSDTGGNSSIEKQVIKARCVLTAQGMLN
jgi:hypothetical protein